MRQLLLKTLFVIALIFPALSALRAAAGVTGSFTLVLDAGHGGHDAGAVGAFSKEKDINLKVTLAVGRLIKANCPDIKLIYTRDKDVFIPLQTRADIANRAKADLFVSIHTNSLPKGRIAYGAETYSLGVARAAANLEVAKRENAVITYEKNYQQTYEGFDPNKAESYIIFELLQDKYMEQSVELARAIQQQYTAAGRKNKGVHQAGFLVLRKTSMPAVLTELGFISTPDEERYLNSEAGVAALARSIYNGIVKYRNAHASGKQTPLLPVTEAPTTSAQKPEPAAASQTGATASKENAPTAQRQSAETAATARVVPVETAASEPAPQPTPKPTKPAKEETRTASTTPEAPADNSQPVFKIQLFTSDKRLNASDKRFKGLTDTDFYRDGGMLKYTYGASTSYAEIRALQKTIKEKFPDTFIVAFIGGKRTDLQEAIKLSQKK